MRAVTQILCGVLMCSTLVGCWRAVSTSPPPPPVVEIAEPAEPMTFVVANSTGEADMELVETGQQQLKDKSYTPLPVYSEKGKLGIVRLTKGDSAKLDDAVVMFEDTDVTDSLVKLETGYVFFNVDKTGPVKVGDLELQQGECVLFEKETFRKLDLTIAAP